MPIPLCDCGITTNFVLPNQDCSLYLADVNRIIMRAKQAAGANNILKTDALTQATWQTDLSLPVPNVRKMAITPVSSITEYQNTNVGNVTTSANTAGREVTLGSKGYKIVGKFNHLSQATLNALLDLKCNPMEIFLVLNDGKILASEVDALNVTGIKVDSFYLEPVPTRVGNAPIMTNEFPFEFVVDDAWFANSFLVSVNFGLDLLN